MSRKEGNAHGKHFTEDEREDDAQRNHNQSKGHRHFAVDENQHAGGHSDKHASATSDTGGQQHEFRRDINDDDINHHDEAQSEGHMQGTQRKSGGHQSGRNQKNT